QIVSSTLRGSWPSPTLMPQVQNVVEPYAVHPLYAPRWLPTLHPGNNQCDGLLQCAPCRDLRSEQPACQQVIFVSCVSCWNQFPLILPTTDSTPDHTDALLYQAHSHTNRPKHLVVVLQQRPG